MGSRVLLVLGFMVLLEACSSERPGPVAAVAGSRPPDAQHAGITTPHGDHSPHHGGIVLMKDELHYEVVLDLRGRHAVWFSDAVREELPASVASKVAMIVLRPDDAAEALTLAIDENGESWIASGRPVSGSDVMVTVTFTARGEPFEVEIPFPSLKTQ